MSSPFFSVIIPTYNRAQCLKDAAQSVLDQSFTDFELIVVDDGSTDDTWPLIRSFCEKDHRVRYIYQQNAERSAARNNGIREANGKFICFLDSDDLYLIHHLQGFHETICAYGQKAALYYCGVVYPSPLGYDRAPRFEPDTDDPMELIVKTAICSQQTCIAKRILDRFHFNPEIRVGEDQELWSRIVRHYELVRSEHYGVIIRDLGDRTISDTNIDSHIANLNLKKRLINDDTDDRIRPEWRRFMLSAAYYRLAKAYLKRGESGKFYWNLLSSMAVSPKHYWKEKVLLLLKNLRPTKASE